MLLLALFSMIILRSFHLSPPAPASFWVFTWIVSSVSFLSFCSFLWIASSISFLYCSSFVFNFSRSHFLLIFPLLIRFSFIHVDILICYQVVVRVCIHTWVTACHFNTIPVSALDQDVNLIKSLSC